MNRVDDDVALEVASHEGLVRQTYKDSKGIPTWSIGVTSASGHDVDRYVGKPQPLEHCLAVFAWLLENKYAPAVRKAFGSRTLTQAQFAAALSFHYNAGAISRASWVKKWLAGDIAGARKAFMDWRKPAEIIPRREKERDLFFDGKWSNDGKITEYTRLTGKMTPDWGSARRVDARAALKAALASAAPAPTAPRPPKPATVSAPPSPATMTEYEIRALQQQLHDALYTEVGFVDGKIGTRTRAALFAFQTDNALPATGEMNTETRAFILAHGVPARQLAPERERATAASLAEAGRLPPAAQAALKGGFWAKVQAAFATVAMMIYGAWEQSGDALSSLSPFKEDLLAAGPWLFFAAVIGISLVLWLRSRNAVDQTVRAVRLGRDTGA
ncbi:glycoside hydrolase family protein [Ancylobacter sp. IITR112]|uniref:glycoside hydrolase family protein n=1 Tax=Ancylobacter sp. IITR112 TaxID=3138073 RepID=UPI00352B5371